MLPTKDKEAIQTTKDAIYFNITPISEIGGIKLMLAIDRMTTSILADLEKLGYHKEGNDASQP